MLVASAAEDVTKDALCMFVAPAESGIQTAGVGHQQRVLGVDSFETS